MDSSSSDSFSVEEEIILESASTELLNSDSFAEPIDLRPCSMTIGPVITLGYESAIAIIGGTKTSGYSEIIVAKAKRVIERTAEFVKAAAVERMIKVFEKTFVDCAIELSKLNGLNKYIAAAAHGGKLSHFVPVDFESFDAIIYIPNAASRSARRYGTWRLKLNDFTVEKSARSKGD